MVRRRRTRRPVEAVAAVGGAGRIVVGGAGRIVVGGAGAPAAAPGAGPAAAVTPLGGAARCG